MFRSGSWKVAAIAAVMLFMCVHSIRAADFPGSVQGVVKSASGQALSGAYVKLFNPEKRLTFMVISQEQGRYTLNNLPPGSYTVQGIGNGFQSKPAPVELRGGPPATADVSLTDKQGDPVANGWIRTPGRVAGNEMDNELPPPNLPEGDGKQIVMTKCAQCHYLHRLTQMRFAPGIWEQKIAWMRERIHENPTKAVDLTDQEAKTVVAYLSKNFNGEPGSYNPRFDLNGRLSRNLLKGDAAKYVAVDFEIPVANAAAHDMTVDPRGVAWVNELNSYNLGRFDPKTYTFTQVPPPAATVKLTALNHMGPPARGAGDSIWMAEIGANRRWLQFDTRTQEFTSYPVPPDFKGPVSGNTMRVDPNGKMVWTTAGTRIVGMNLQTRQYTAYDIPTKNPNAYGMDVAGDGTVWFAEREANKMGRLNPATGKIDEFPTPGIDVPRRMGADWDGNLWVAFHQTGKLVKIDYKTTKMTIYQPPTENSGAYHVVADPKHKVVWLTEQTADKIARFDPKTETWTEFSLPIVESDARRIELDPSNPNRIWWSGDTSSHLGYIEVLEK